MPSTADDDDEGDTELSEAEALNSSKEAIAQRLRESKRGYWALVVLTPLFLFVVTLVLSTFGDGGVQLEEAVGSAIFVALFFGVWMWFLAFRPELRRLRELSESDAMEPVEVLSTGKNALTVGQPSRGEGHSSLLVVNKASVLFRVGQQGWRHFSPTSDGLATFIAGTAGEPAPLVAGPAKVKRPAGQGRA